MIERLRTRAVDAGVAHLVDAFVGDAAALPFDASECDAAVSNFGVIFCADIDGALRELARVTRADGALMVSAWSREAQNGWTSLLGPDHADVLGFRLPPRPMYHWSSSDEFASACGRAGWVDVAVDEADGVPSTFDSADHIGDALEVPASKAVLRSLSESQHATLRAYLEHRARELFGDGEVRLPRHAWLATGRASL
jgi:SAM-dependent methyltransferase